ncbi:MAG: hypothetical protein KDD44_12315 [Bdellovibrionales bacterium]|nr:hypothetical protein [Bdellovibrionales bacterium]
MGRLANAVSYFQQHGLGPTLAFSTIKLRSALARNDIGWRMAYELNPFVQSGSFLDYGKCSDRTWAELKQLPNLECREIQIDRTDYEAYVARAEYARYSPYYEGGDSGNVTHRTEKLLQHYLSLQLLQVTDGDVYIDVASNTSPMKDIVRRLFGVESYSMDLVYEPGVHGDQIGCDAGATGLPDGFASKMSLHCAFEHFAYGSDMRFVREAGRILRPGGKVCIVPLYVMDHYCIRCDPTLEMDISIRDTEGARIEYVRNYNVDFGRFYDAKRLQERILDNLGPLRATLYRFSNLSVFEPEEVYSNFALVLEQPTHN